MTAIQGAPLVQFNIDERLSWSEQRQTKRGEDMAYCLLGIFEISMPLIYGEGEECARRRLWEEIQKSSARSRYYKVSGVRPDWIGSKAQRLMHDGFVEPMYQGIGPDDFSTYTNLSDMSAVGSEADPFGIFRGRESVLDFDDRRLLQRRQKQVHRQALRMAEGWLDAPATDRDYEDRLEECLEGTCEWVFGDPAFTAWLQHSDAVRPNWLWIHGGAGLGKSVLCSKIVRDMQSCQPQSTAYFFSSAAARNGWKPKDIIRSWLSQLGEKDADILNIICSYMGAKNTERRALQSDIWEILGRIL